MLRILIADDEYLESESLRVMIEKSDVPTEIVAIAKDGEMALQLCQKYSPNVVFLDAVMPVLYGLSVGEEIRKKDKKKKIVITSGYDKFEYVLRALHMKAEDFLLKPIRPEVVIQVLHRLQTQEDIAVIKEGMILLQHYIEKRHYKASYAIIEDLIVYLQKIPNIDWNEACRHIYETVFLPFGVSCFSEKTVIQKKAEAILFLQECLEAVNVFSTYDKLPKTNNLKKAIDYIAKHYQEELFLKDVAKELNFSVSYLSKLFKKELGINFNKIVTKKRIEEAKKLLLKTEYSINEIAFEVGYQEPNYFCRIFKQEEGMTPLKYRQKNK